MKLTKTDFIAYLDAPRHLWAIKNNKMDKKEIGAYLEHLFEQGYEVERYAEQYIQQYLKPEYKAKEQDILIQPTHIDGDFEARTDVLILNPQTKKWDMYEIKSTTSITKKHKYDATFQTLIFQQKYKLGDIYILHLNREYVRGDVLDLKALFKATRITDEVNKLKDKVHELRYEALETIQEEDYRNVPACIRPKTCPCLGVCHQNLPEYSIYDINNLTASEKKIRQLEEMGIYDIDDVPHDFPLTDKQRFQVQVAQSKESSIDIKGIQKDLQGLEYPLYFIDYESFNPAIPMYKGYKPYDQMPFQWSLHVQELESAPLKHYEFIETERINPIQNFLKELSNIIGETGSIIVWNKTFEGTQNKRMGKIHPEFAEFCKSMNARMYDLMDIFRDGIYADPKFKGSYSIKKVLPVLVPELSYKDMEISEGATAMANWYEMVYANTSSEQIEHTKRNLLKYCELDTEAMVEIFKVLKKLV